MGEELSKSWNGMNGAEQASKVDRNGTIYVSGALGGYQSDLRHHAALCLDLCNGRDTCCGCQVQ